MPERELELSRAAVRLRAVSPDSWDDFLKTLVVYSDGVTERCISSPVDVLQNAQGRAQAVARLLQLMNDAPALVERIAQKGR